MNEAYNWSNKCAVHVNGAYNWSNKCAVNMNGAYNWPNKCTVNMNGAYNWSNMCAVNINGVYNWSNMYPIIGNKWDLREEMDVNCLNQDWQDSRISRIKVAIFKIVWLLIPRGEYWVIKCCIIVMVKLHIGEWKQIKGSEWE